MRLLVDENIHRQVIAGLRAEGHDIIAVAEDRPRASDEEIVAWAETDGRVLITSDRDFGRLLVTEQGADPAGVIYLRLPRLAVDAILDRLRQILTSDEKVKGHLVVIAPAGERWRPLKS